MSCQIEDTGETLAVCFDDKTVFYRFGAIGAPPDLELAEAIATIDYLPWPGVGRSIWETVTFYSGDYSYEIVGGFVKPFGDEEFEDAPHLGFGGVRVMQGDTDLIELECAGETVNNASGEGLWTAKNNLGFTWDYGTKVWVELPD